MKYLTITIRDETGKVIDIQNIETLDAACPSEISAGAFANERQASEYLANLRAIYGLPPAQAQQPAKTGKRKRVVCCQTGTVYPTAAAAARAYGVSTSAMTMHLRHPEKHGFIKGWHTFERLST